MREEEEDNLYLCCNIIRHMQDDPRSEARLKVNTQDVLPLFLFFISGSTSQSYILSLTSLHFSTLALYETTGELVM